MTPLRQDVGMHSVAMTMLNSLAMRSLPVQPDRFRSSAGIPSSPEALLFAMRRNPIAISSGEKGLES